ncbi:MAG: tetratricopeptide repeat protein [Thermodesulfobacteriota bacterium]
MFPKPPDTVVFILLSIVLSYGVAVRNAVWVAEISLWKDVAGKSAFKARPHTQYGLVLESAGDVSEAESRYLRAMRLDPVYFEAYGALAVIYGKAGDMDKAEALFKSILRRFPNDYKSRSGLGVTYLLRGRLNEAEEAFKASLESSPDYVPAFQNLINLYMLAGREREADEYRKKLSALTRE